MSTRRSRPPSPLQGELLAPFDPAPPPPAGFDSSAAGLSGSGADAGLRQPLADRLRPQLLAEVAGQSHLLGPDGSLFRAIEAGRPPSMILWGPPGCGKTTLAHVIAQRTSQGFERLSAVLGGVAELRQIVARAKDRRALGRGTIVFVDEIHRFNKAQQDAFLPHVESGALTLIGATTENPSFSVNAAVLSRCKVFHLRLLTAEAIEGILARALEDEERGLGGHGLSVEEGALARIAEASRGDARRALGLLETLVDRAVQEGTALTVSALERERQQQPLLYDKAGEEHYNVVSALIKSMRGSDPDAAIYWLMRMVESGDDPLFILRRLMIFASEDVGNADPNALCVAVDADRAFRRMGLPEGLYPMAHACLYLASAPKSNSVGNAFKAAKAAIERHGALPVPEKLRNAVTDLMQEEGYGQGYQYAHDHAGHYVPGETYLPEPLLGERYYQPSEQGFEKAIAERLARWRAGAASPSSPTASAPEAPAARERRGRPKDE